MTSEVKKGIRINTQRTAKLVTIISKALKDSKMSFSIYELFVAFYVILRNQDLASRQAKWKMKAEGGKK